MAGARWSSCRQNNSSCDRRWPLPATGIFSDAEVIRKFGASRRLRIFSNQRVGWVERSDTHQLHLMEMMGFAGSTHPAYYVLRLNRLKNLQDDVGLRKPHSSF